MAYTFYCPQDCETLATIQRLAIYFVYLAI